MAIEVIFLRLVESVLNITFAWGESSQYTQCTTVALNCRCLFLPATHKFFFFPAALHIMMMCISLPCWQTMWKEHGSQIALNLAEEGNTFCSTHELHRGQFDSVCACILGSEFHSMLSEASEKNKQMIYCVRFLKKVKSSLLTCLHIG